uniref:Uncharacterized protein n=1 Tax=Picea glauca TaxID=3330 RepID=A0A101LXY5_PICGL|nr:hypothetical protein ABT39_MTgene5566 [Picea glauca]
MPNTTLSIRGTKMDFIITGTCPFHKGFPIPMTGGMDSICFEV